MKIDNLELKHIAKHLPYGLKCYGMGMYEESDDEYETPILFTITGTWVHVDNDDRYAEVKDRRNETESLLLKTDVFPLMFPLSAITQEITVNGETFVPIRKLLEAYCFNLDVMTEEEINSYAESMVEVDMSQLVAEMLMEWHFDIDNLIENKLAIDVTTLKENPYK